jgi:hypothetical protein
LQLHICQHNDVSLGCLEIKLNKNQKEPINLYDLLKIDEKYKIFIKKIEPYFISFIDKKVACGFVLLDSNVIISKDKDDNLIINPLTSDEKYYVKFVKRLLSEMRFIRECIKHTSNPLAIYSRYLQYLELSNIVPRYNHTPFEDFFKNNRVMILPDKTFLWFLGHLNHIDIFTDMISNLYFYDSESYVVITLGEERLSKFVRELVLFSTPESLLTKNSQCIKKTMEEVCTFFSEEKKEDLENECD